MSLAKTSRGSDGADVAPCEAGTSGHLCFASIRHVSRPGYWLYADGEPIVHLIPGTGGPIDRRGEMIDHVGFRLIGYDGYRRKLDALGVSYSTMELPAIGERRLFIHTPAGILPELVFRQGDSVSRTERNRHDA